MLSTINLQLTEFDLSGGNSSPLASLAPATAEPAASFADLLRAPVLVPPPLVGGDDLPLDGNALPSPDSFDQAPILIGGRGMELLPRSENAALLPDTGISEIQAAALAQSAEDTAADAAKATSLPALALLAETGARAPERSAVPLLPDDGSVDDGTQLARPRVEVAPAVEVLRTRGEAPEATARTAPTVSVADAAAEAAALARATASERANAAPLVAEGGPVLSTSAASSTPSNGSAALPAGLAPSAAPAAATAAATPVQTSIPVAVQDQNWGELLSERVLFMSSNRIQSAEIRLSPAELGPLRVNVAVEDGAATVTFTAQHAVTREAIETALPRLREMLGDSGLTLGNANVADQGVSRDGPRAEAEEAAAPGGDTAAEVVDADLPPPTVRAARGLVDTFA